MLRDVLVLTVPLLFTFVVVVVALRDDVLPLRESDEAPAAREVLVDDEREVDVEAEAGVALVREVELLFVVAADVLLREDEEAEPDDVADLTSLVL